MVVAFLTIALLIVKLHPEIWKGLLEERNLTLIAIGVSLTAIIVLLAIGAQRLDGQGSATRRSGTGCSSLVPLIPKPGRSASPRGVACGTFFMIHLQEERPTWAIHRPRGPSDQRFCLGCR